MLRLIWDISLLLAGFALGVMMLLVLLRIGSTWRQNHMFIARRRVAPLLLGGTAISSDRLEDIPDAVVTQLTLELIQLVRGEERTHFVEKATALGVPGASSANCVPSPDGGE